MYKIVKFFSGVTLRVFYKKIFFFGREKIPDKDPMLLACTHSNGLIDPVIPPCNLKRGIHFITRGDVFKKQFLWFLNSLNMIPIFRFVDGYTNMKNNMSVFQAVHDRLGEGKAILIFPESFTEPVKRLRPLQKGTARMAFGAMESSDIPDIKIVPVGINFTYPTKPRCNAYLVTGNPISVKDYWPDYQENKQAALRNLTTRIKEELTPLVIHVENEEDDILAEALLRIHRTDNPVSIIPNVESSDKEFLGEKNITDQVNELNELKKVEYRSTAELYLSAIDKNKILDENIGKKQSLIFSLFKVLLLIIPTLLGLVLHFIPYLIANWYTDKKVRKMKFYTTVLFPSYVVAFFVFYLILLIVLCISFGWWGLIWLAMIMILGWISINGVEYFKKVMGAIKFQGLPMATREELKSKRDYLKNIIAA